MPLPYTRISRRTLSEIEASIPADSENYLKPIRDAIPEIPAMIKRTLTRNHHLVGAD